jgi:predicted nucleotidyltransferase
MIDPADLQTAERIRDTLLEAGRASIGRIVLHGSRASGRARPTSDYDILVVMRHEVEDCDAESMRLSQLFAESPSAVDVQVFGKEEFEECRPVPATIAYPADQYGVVLYADP